MTAWDSNRLWLKAKFFAEKALQLDQSQPDYPFWLSLALECLARAALTHIHPVLNADPGNEHNLLYACGVRLIEQPKSIPAHSVYVRLEKCIERFGKTQRELCDFMGLLRNQHLHTADIPYEGLSSAKWLARYYEVSLILNEFIGKTLSEYFDPETAGVANSMIKALTEGTLKIVKDKISEFSKAFSRKSSDEKSELSAKAKTLTTRLPSGSTMQKCPACSSDGELRGELIKESEPFYNEGELLITDTYVGMEYECFACGLKLKNLEEIANTEMEPQFSETRPTTLHEFHEPDFYFEYDNM